MGCSTSQSLAFQVAANKLEFKKLLREVEQLGLTITDVRKIYYVYDSIVSKDAATVSLSELLAHIDIPRTAFIEKLFSLFNSNSPGELDFRAFLLCIWNYSTLTRVNLDMFAFDLYDKDGGRPLSPAEIATLLEEIFGPQNWKYDSHAKSAAAELKLCEERKKTFTMDKFHLFVLDHPALLFPAAQLQVRIQNKVGGASFWKKLTDRRVEQSTHSYVSIAHLLDPNKLGLHNSLAASTMRSRSGSGTSSHKSKRTNSKVYADSPTSSASSVTLMEGPAVLVPRPSGKGSFTTAGPGSGPGPGPETGVAGLAGTTAIDYTGGRGRSGSGAMAAGPLESPHAQPSPFGKSHKSFTASNKGSSSPATPGGRKRAVSMGTTTGSGGGTLT